MRTFKRIALIANSRAHEVKETVAAVVRFLTARGVVVVLDEFCATLLPDSGLPTAPAHLPSGCDLAITIGGDGTMLRAARVLADHDVPLLGINRGRLGFLAELSEDRLGSAIGPILAEKFSIEERRMIDVWLGKDRRKARKLGVALNEMLIVREGLRSSLTLPLIAAFVVYLRPRSAMQKAT